MTAANPPPRRAIRVFFSWQSDLDQALTSRAIRGALRAALTDLEAKHPVDLLLEEATSNTPGSPYIPFELAEKIRKSDVFVGDITTVVHLNGSGKSQPNANVTFELGVASAQVGWSRIIMLFNTALAEMKDLPFDFDRHRISTYAVAGDKGAQKGAVSALTKMLVMAIERIILDDPRRPRELEGKAPEDIKRARDVENIRWFLRQISTSALDQHIESLPSHLGWSAAYMHDGLHGVVHSSDFLLYDQDAYQLMIGLYEALGETLNYDQFYRETRNIRVQAFGRRGDMITNKEELDAMNKINVARIQLREKLTGLLALLHERYLEIDTADTNRLFAQAMSKAADDL